jgi:hypothetical protein
MNGIAREGEGYLLGPRMSRFHPPFLFECSLEERGFLLFLGIFKVQLKMTPFTSIYRLFDPVLTWFCPVLFPIVCSVDVLVLLGDLLIV